MELILGLALFAIVLSAFYTNTSLLFYGYLIAVVATIGLHTYDCLVISVLATGTCQDLADVIDQVGENMAAIAGAFVLAHTGLSIK